MMNFELGEEKRIWPVVWQCGIWLEELSITMEILVKLAVPFIDIQILGQQT
jgi:hypothetical protein